MPTTPTGTPSPDPPGARLMNRYPLWKNLLVLLVVLLGLLYAAPNLFGEAPVVQISPLRGAPVDAALEERVTRTLELGGITATRGEEGDGNLVLKFASTDVQLRAQDLLSAELGDDYIVALNLVPEANPLRERGADHGW